MKFDFSTVLNLFCCCIFFYRGVQDLRGKGSWKDPEEYQALHIFSGVTLLACCIAFFVQIFLRENKLLYALTFGAAMICAFVSLVSYLCYHGTRNNDKK